MTEHRTLWMGQTFLEECPECFALVFSEAAFDRHMTWHASQDKLAEDVLELIKLTNRITQSAIDNFRHLDGQTREMDSHHADIFRSIERRLKNVDDRVAILEGL